MSLWIARHISGSALAMLAMLSVVTTASAQTTSAEQISAACAPHGRAEEPDPPPAAFAIARHSRAGQAPQRGRCRRGAESDLQHEHGGWLSPDVQPGDDRGLVVTRPRPSMVLVGGGLGRIFKYGDQPINARVQLFNNVVRPAGAGSWMPQIQVQLLFLTT